MHLALRRGRVASVDRREGSAVELTVEVGGRRRPAIGYRELTGDVEPGDDVVVNVAAVELALGSGGRDIVHVNLTRGLDGRMRAPARALKLNYTSLQHPVDPVEEPADEDGHPPRAAAGKPVAVIGLHGQLEPCAWATAAARPGARVGYVQTEGGALSGAVSRAVRELRERDLLADHVTAGAAFGGEREAMTVAGALAEGLGRLGWDAAIAGPGPGIVGSHSALGHGGLAALDSAHACLGIGARPLVVPRLSSGDPRARHRGLSHHTATVLGLLLRPVSVAVPEGSPEEVARHPAMTSHELRRASADLAGYRASGLSTLTMGRSIDEDELFFCAALAGGRVLAEEIERV
jgi:hypothetical protein